MSRVRRRVRRDRGASAVEYGLMVAAIAAVIVGVSFALGTLVRAAFDRTCSSMVAGPANLGTAGTCPAQDTNTGNGSTVVPQGG